MSSTGPIVSCVLLPAGSSLNSPPSEVTIDMTPKLRKVQEVVGGDVSFVGQWCHPQVEGVVLVSARDSSSMPLNEHPLQPPFHDTEVKGPILLMKTDEDGTPVPFTLQEYEAWQKIEVEEHIVEHSDEEEILSSVIGCLGSQGLYQCIVTTALGY